jgi:hypothetical protein
VLNVKGWITSLILVLLLVNYQPAAAVSPTIYYVSNSTGNDSNTGLSQGAPLKSIAKVNGLNLLPGDQVLFKCGDTWQGEQLVVSRSGTASAPIQFGSYPSASCLEKPSLSERDQPVVPQRSAPDFGTLAQSRRA